MIVNLKPTGRAMSMPGGLTIGAVVSLGGTLLFAAVLAKLVDMEKLAWENIGYGIVVLLLLASFSGAMTAYAKIKRQRLLVCSVSGVIYFGILLAITALFFGGQYEAVGVTAALVFGGSACAWLLGLRGGGSRKGKKIRPVHR